MAKVAYVDASDPPFVLKSCFTPQRCPEKAGIALEMIRILSNSIEISHFVTPDHIGSIENGTWNGLVGLALRDEVDFTVPQLMTTSARFEVVRMIPVFFGSPFCFFHCLFDVHPTGSLKFGNIALVVTIVLQSILLIALPFLLLKCFPDEFRQTYALQIRQVSAHSIVPFPSSAKSVFVEIYNLLTQLAYFVIVSGIMMASISSKNVEIAGRDEVKNANELASKVQQNIAKIAFAEENGAEHDYFKTCTSCGYAQLRNVLSKKSPIFEEDRYKIAQQIRKGSEIYYFTSGLAGTFYARKFTTKAVHCSCKSFGDTASEITSLVTSKKNIVISTKIEKVIDRARDTGIIEKIISIHIPSEKKEKQSHVKHSTSVRTLKTAFLCHFAANVAVLFGFVIYRFIFSDQ